MSWRPVRRKNRPGFARSFQSTTITGNTVAASSGQNFVLRFSLHFSSNISSSNIYSQDQILVSSDMYPKVKVRGAQQQVDRKQKGNRTDSSLIFKGFDSLPLRDFSSAADKKEEHQPITTPSIAKVPKSYVPRSITPPTPIIRVMVKSEKEEFEEEDHKPHIRVSTIPRPRAVLSSPDNDGMIGSKNEVRGHCRPSSSLNDRSNYGFSKCKVNMKQNTSGSPLDHKPVESRVVVDIKSDDTGGKRASNLYVRNRDTKIGKVKSSLTKI